jgi:hypothetical protein
VLSNGQDIEVVAKLITGGPDCQKIDALALGSPTRLRADIALVYVKAARARRGDIATKNQMMLARQALSHLALAHDRLLKIVPLGSRDLKAAFGALAKDLKGLNERNEFTDVCSEILGLDLRNAISKLETALKREAAKPRRTGERKKRLRSLVEALAAWWTETYGLKPTITPKFQGRVLVGHQGPFLDLARAVFCGLDNFNDGEVVATVQDVL